MGAGGIDVGELLHVLLAGEEIALEARPVRLEGGRSADLFRFRLVAGPPELNDRDLVLRLLPDRALSTDECVIHREVARLGYPAPEVMRWGTVDPTHVYMIMPYVEGSSLFEAQSPLRALRRVPQRLAELMVTLHRLDPTPVRAALATREASAAVDARARVLSEIDVALTACGHRARDELRRWLEAHQPEHGRQVVCHGDLHALNVLVNGNVAVLDWELVALGDQAFDIARTKLLLHAVPMDVPKAARPIIERLGQRAAQRFEAAYTSMSPVQPEAIRWYEALHTARMVALLLAERVHADPADGVLQAWTPTLPLLAKTLARWTGVPLA